MSELHEIVKCREANNHEKCLREGKTGINNGANCDLCIRVFFEELRMKLAELDLQETVNLCETCKNDFAICEANPVFVCDVTDLESLDGTIADRIIRCDSYSKKVKN